MEFRSDTPIFQQIADLIADAILSGAYAEETAVPSITEFSVAYRINPATANKGVNLLVEAGYLYKKRGVGMFVSVGARARIREERKQRFYRDYAQPAVREAMRLGIGREELNDMMKRGYEDNGNGNPID